MLCDPLKGVTTIEIKVLRKTFGGAIHRVDVVVAVVKEIAHLFPWRLGGALIVAAQNLIQRGQAFMALTVCLMQCQKGARQAGCVGGGQAKIGQLRCCFGKQRIGQRLAQVGDDAFGIAR